MNGTGKTLATIAVAGQLYLQNHITKMLVVAPLSICGVWKEEFAKFADYPYTLEILDGSTADKMKALQRLERQAVAGGSVDNEKPSLQVAVINYESAWRMEAELAYWRPTLIVCDESSKVKNPQAKQSKAMHRLGRVAKHTMALTGTPVTASPLDFYSQYKFLDPTIFDSSFYVFRAKHAILGGYGNHQIVGYKNLDDLTAKAHSIAYRITKAEALDLPEQVDVTRQIVLEPKAMTTYKQIEKDCVAQFESGDITADNILVKLMRLSQVTGGYLKVLYPPEAGKQNGDSKVEQVSTAKMQALEEIIEQCIDENKKLVVFARFIPEIDGIEKLLKKKSIGYSLICGATKDRAEQVAKFQNDPTTKVFVGQIATTGMGLTLTAADTVVFYSLSFNYSDYEQAKARVHRIGQQNKCVYYHLIAKGTIDEKVLEALKNKKSIADLVVDNWQTLFTKSTN